MSAGIKPICGLCGRVFKNEYARGKHVQWHNPDLKAKISKIHKGRDFSESHRANLSKAMRRRFSRKSERERLSKQHIGMKASDEARKHMSEAWHRNDTPERREEQRRCFKNLWKNPTFRTNALDASRRNALARADRIRRQKFGDEWADIYKNGAIRDVLFMLTLDLGRKPEFKDYKELFGIDYNAFANMVRNNHLDRYVNKRVYHSDAENDMLGFIDSLTNNARHDDKSIHPMRLDVVSGDIAFEFNGIFWHSTKGDANGRGRLGYEQKKLSKCEKKGIKLFTIWEDEWAYSRPLIELMIRLIVHDRFNEYVELLLESGYAYEDGDSVVFDQEKMPPLLCSSHGVEIIDTKPPSLISRTFYMKNGNPHTYECWNCGYLAVNKSDLRLTE